MSVDLYAVGARVWIESQETVWEEGTVKERRENELVVEAAASGEDRTIDLTKKGLPPLKNPEILIGENDLTSLSYLHEPAVLHNLEVRFINSNTIYTYCGIVLVAINPYEKLPIYGQDVIDVYRASSHADVDPHVYAVAGQAYNQLARDGKNQSVIISGESGAGKTVSAKYAMRFFASVGGSGGETQIEKKVLASNPIMEAVGNAKTIRNDNSSRFGKYIELGFSRRNHIMGANMRTYLLEKTRVVQQASNERNFHIFYQMCAVQDDEDMKDLQLSPCGHFVYLRGGNCPEIDGVDDAEDFYEVQKALMTVGIKPEEQRFIFRVLAAVLHFGNVEYKTKSRSSEASMVVPNDPHFPVVAELLGVKKDELQRWLCDKKITTRNETLIQHLRVDVARQARDALAKHLYSLLFAWIVNKINRVLASQQEHSSFIGVLDIYGFEIFDINSFEQFCINFANEKLQQQFTQHVFKLEQDEYVKEEISWSFIEFYDNAPCIDLIENSKTGIIAMLDEECRLPKGSDKAWCEKMGKAYKDADCKHFLQPRFGQGEVFVVIHFAASVEYTCESFLEKNKDSMIQEHLLIMQASQDPLVARLFTDLTDITDGQAPSQPSGSSTKTGKSSRDRSSAAQKGKATRAGGGGADLKRTVANKFKDSLQKLMATLNTTTPNYIRCIKPNDDKAAFVFDPHRAVEQLRACGVLETIRISSAGYPSRRTYREFIDRYGIICRKKVNKQNLRGSCETIVRQLIEDDDKYQFGKAKIFFRAGQLAYLERLLSDLQIRSGILIQKTVRRYLCQKRYTLIRRSALLIQQQGRGVLARRHAQFLRETRAATRIQAWVRGLHCRREYLKTRHNIIVVQSVTRGLIARHLYREKLRNYKATKLQSCIRGWLARQHYKRVQHATVFMQCCLRRRAAKRELRKLKIEARSVGKLQELNKGMENKIVQLQLKLDAQNKENQRLRQELQAASTEQANLSGQAELRASVLETEMASVQGELVEAKEEIASLKMAKEEVERLSEEEINALQRQITDLTAEIEKMKEVVQLEVFQDTNKEDEADSHQLVTELEQLQRELGATQGHHQKLLHEYNSLQQRFDLLKDELNLARTDASQPESVSSGYPPSRSSLGSSREDLQTAGEEVNKHQLMESLSYDAEVILRLKTRITDLESERNQLLYRLEERESLHSQPHSEGDGAEASPERSKIGKVTAKSLSALSLMQHHDGMPSLLDENQERSGAFSAEDLLHENERLSKEISKLRSEQTLQREELVQSAMTAGDEPIKEIAAELEKTCNTVSNLQEEIDQLRHANNKLRLELDEACQQPQRSLRARTASGTSMTSMTLQEENDELQQQLEERSQSMVRAAMRSQRTDEDVDAVKKLASELDRLRRDNQQMRVKLQIHMLTPTLPESSETEENTSTAHNHIQQTPKRRNIEMELELACQQIAVLKETNCILHLELDKKTEAVEDLQAENRELEAELAKSHRKGSETVFSGTLDARLQQECTRLTDENLDLQVQVETLQEKLRSTEVQVVQTTSPDGRGSNVPKKQVKHTKEDSDRPAMAAAAPQQPEYRGILRYQPSDEPRLVKRLITELNFAQLKGQLPSLPAHVLFMCLRYLDEVGDERRVQSLMTTSMSSIRKLLRNKPKDIEVRIFWLGSCCTLLQHMKQYSGEKAFLPSSPALQRHCLSAFDLTNYRMLLNDLAVSIYQEVVKAVQETIQPLIVSGMLEHETLPGTATRRPTRARVNKDPSKKHRPADIIAELAALLKLLTVHCVDPQVTTQLFTQICYVINGYMLNNVLLRRDLCHWSHGLQIRYNLTQLEEWLHDSLADSSSATAELKPMVQAAQLLQIEKKTKADADAIYDLCYSLNPVQVQKLLAMYTPANEFEERVPAVVIRAVADRGRELADPTKLMADIHFIKPVTFQFKPNNLEFQSIQIPETLNLGFLQKA